MKTISSNDLKKILRKHILWLRGDPDGERADLSEANLYGANLRGADLSEADLYKANLSRANLSRANLSRANLSRANLSRANLREVYLGEANLRGADLYGANLRGANLRGANLRGADLSEVYLGEANLRGADLSEADLYKANLSRANLSRANLSRADLSEANDLRLPIACPEEGSFIGFKKCLNELIVKLEIPADALRCSATTRKCRCSKAKVLSITNVDGSDAYTDTVASKYDKNFIYKVGETVEVRSFNTDRWDECSAGIHFFITRQEAVEYNL